MDLSYTAGRGGVPPRAARLAAGQHPGRVAPARLLGVAGRRRELPAAPRLGARQGRGRVRRHPVAHRVRRPRRHPGHEGDLRRGDGAGRRAAHGQRARPDLPRAHRDGDRHRRAAEGDHRADAAQRGDLVPGLLRARRRLRPRRAGHQGASATATTSWSTARRCGPPTPCTATRSSRWSAPSRAAQRHRGISMLLIDMHQPGVDARPLKQMSGASEFGEVFFTDARVPATEVPRRDRRRLAHRDAAAVLRARRVGHRAVHRVPPPVRRDRRPSRSGWAATGTRCCATGWPGSSPTWSACGCTRCTCSPRSSRAATWASRRR